MSADRARAIEAHGIDFVPLSERYGTPLSLLTLWFSSNMIILGVSIGALGAAYGLSFRDDVAAIVVGNAIGTAFMAAHSAQGPQLGIPQMIQGRAQFGVLGAALPLAAVVTTYLLYCVANDLLIQGTLQAVWPMSARDALALFFVITLVIAFVGYRIIHLLGAVLSVMSLLFFVCAAGLLLTHHTDSENHVAQHASTGVVFALVVTQASAWGLSYGPYVADYSRYLPPTVSASRTFWYTAAGCFLGSTLIMAFGALLAARTPGLTDDYGGAVAALFGRARAMAQIMIILGVIIGNVMNLYSAYMAVVTIVSGFRRRASAGLTQKFVVMLALMTIAMSIALLASGHLQSYLGDMLNALVYLLVPWSAINLADYYLVRKGHYKIEDIYRLDGIYGAYQWRTIGVYFLGIVIQVPFVQTSLYTGPIAHAVGVDLAWLPGLLVPGILHVLVDRPREDLR